MKTVRKASHKYVDKGGKPIEEVSAGAEVQDFVEAMKLAVALDLCLEGYDEVTFNKRFSGGDVDVCVHVFAEDAVGSKVAVYCVGGAELSKRDKLADVVYQIADCVGEECQIAIAIPLRLLNLVDEVKDVVYRIYMVDEGGRLWVHDPSKHFSIMMRQKFRSALPLARGQGAIQRYVV